MNVQYQKVEYLCHYCQWKIAQWTNSPPHFLGNKVVLMSTKKGPTPPHDSLKQLFCISSKVRVFLQI